MNILINNNSANDLANKLAQIIRNAIKENGEANIVVSGGSTPKLMLKALFSIKIKWQKVTLFLSDERFVPMTHKDSNESMLRQIIAQADLRKNNQPQVVSYYLKNLSIEKAINQLERQLIDIKSFDAVVIGMGLDGHFASLFPDDENLDKKLDLLNPKMCCSVQTKNSPYLRISLTFSCLVKTDSIFVLISGYEKLKVLQKAKLGLKKKEYQVPVSALYHPSFAKDKVYTYYQDNVK